MTAPTRPRTAHPAEIPRKVLTVIGESACTNRFFMFAVRAAIRFTTPEIPSTPSLMASSLRRPPASSSGVFRPGQYVQPFFGLGPSEIPEGENRRADHHRDGDKDNDGKQHWTHDDLSPQGAGGEEVRRQSHSALFEPLHERRAHAGRF